MLKHNIAKKKQYILFHGAFECPHKISLKLYEINVAFLRFIHIALCYVL